MNVVMVDDEICTRPHNDRALETHRGGFIDYSRRMESYKYYQIFAGGYKHKLEGDPRLSQSIWIYV